MKKKEKILIIILLGIVLIMAILAIVKNQKESQKNIVEEKIMMTENTVNGYVTKEVDTTTITSNENKIEPYIPNN